MKLKQACHHLILVALITPAGICAADGTWSVDADGNWSDTGNWSGGTVADGTDATAFFIHNITALRTVTLDTPRTVGNISFTDSTANSHNLTISGANILTLDVSSDTPIIDVTQNNRVLRIESIIAGNDGLQKNGLGNLTLGGANTFTGGLTMNGGTIQLTSTTDSLGAAGTTIRVISNSTLNFAVGGTHTFDKALDVQAGATFTTIKGATGTSSFTGVVSGAGIIKVNDAGSVNQRPLIFANTANTFTGAIDLSNNQSTITFNSISDAPGSGNIIFGLGTAGRTGAFQLGAGTAEPIVLNNRRIELISGAASGGSARINNTNATASNTITINSDLLVTGTGGTKTLQLGGINTGDNTFAGLIANGGFTTLGITKADSGRWRLTNANNSYSGVTSLVVGTLEVTKFADGNDNSSIGASSNAATNLLLGNNTTLLYTGSGDSTDRGFTINGNGAGHQATISSSGSGAVTFTNTASPAYGPVDQTRILNIGGTNNDLNILAATLNDNGTGALRLNKTGTGTWVLASTDSTYTGITDITGTLVVPKLADGGSPSSIGASANDAASLLLRNEATLRYTGGGDTSARAFTINGASVAHSATLDASGTGALVLTHAGGLGYGSNNQTRTLNLTGTNTDDNTLFASLANNGSGALSVNKTGAGTWILAGNNTYTGATVVGEGTLLFNGSNASGGLITVDPNATVGGIGSVGNVFVSDEGTLAPGASAGTLTTSSLTLSPTSRLEFELGAPNMGSSPLDSDYVFVQNALVLGGELHITALPSFGAPHVGDTWVLFDYQPGNLTEIGVSMASTPAGYGFAIDTSSVDGQVLLVTTLVPEPSTFLLLALGMLAVVRRIRLHHA